MKRQLKPIPKFKNEKQEHNFWSKHETAEFFDISNPIRLDFSNLKRSTKPITIRLPQSLVSSLKLLANKKDVPYQSLMKIFLAQKIQEERLVSGGING